MTGLWGTIQHALSSSTSAVEAIFMVLETLYVELNQRLISLFWSLQKHRNLRVWDDITEFSVVVVERAKNLVVDWQLANIPVVAKSISPQQVHQPVEGWSSSAVGTHAPVNASIWQRPSPCRYKYNIDAAFSSHFNHTGIGICIRDSERTFVLAKVGSYLVVIQLTLLKLWGYILPCSGLAICNLTTLISKQIPSLLVLLSMLLETTILNLGVFSCRTLVSSFFNNSRVEFVRRKTNEVVHVLAGETTLLTSTSIYFHIPECIESLIINEML